MKKMTKIYDTSSLLLTDETSLFDPNFNTVITSITLKELERIKTSANKDANIKYAARQLLKALDQHPFEYECYIYKPSMNSWLEKYDLEINDDAKILAAAYDYANMNQTTNIVFYTNDMALKKIAEIFFGSNVMSITTSDDEYTGFKEYCFDDTEMADFYSNPL